MKAIKVILKFFDEFDREFQKDCMEIDEFLLKIDKALEDDWEEFKKGIKIRLQLIDEADHTFLKQNCNISEFKKESLKLKEKLS